MQLRLCSTWRPLLPVIEDNPLAFCDSRSVAPSDLVLTDRVFPNYIYTLYFLKHNPAQRWHWVSEQTSSEIILMLMYDTESGAARCEMSPRLQLSHLLILGQSVLMGPSRTLLRQQMLLRGRVLKPGLSSLVGSD